MSIFNYVKTVPKSNISDQNSSGNINTGFRNGETKTRYFLKAGKFAKNSNYFTPQPAM